VTARKWIPALVVAVPLLGVNAASIGAEKTVPKAPASFGTLKAPSLDAAREQALAWLKGTGKTDAATLTEFDELWKQTDRSLLDLVTTTLTLGDAEAAKLLSEARDPSTPAPTTVPSIIKDEKRPVFFRSNLGLAYAKALSNRRVFEELVDVLKAVKPEQVVDPAAYFFHRAVAEHALLLKPEANRSIVGLLEDVSDAPDRYKMVGVLMFYDMQAWRDKDLGAIARKMENIERRLDLARGGPQTQKIQKEVVARLDEIIKELEKPSS
jgi:hypothetical protein